MTRTLIRRGWLIPVITAAVAAIAYVIADHQATSYTSDATLVVPSGVQLGPKQAAPAQASPAQGTPAEPAPLGSPSDATDLARTYAAQIPEDDHVVDAVARGLHVSRSEARDSLTAAAGFGTDPGSQTALVTLTYQADSPSQAQSGANSAVAAVTGAHPSATAVTPGSLRLISSPEKGSASGLSDTAITIGGGVVGFALALLLLFTWERTDRRIDRPEDLAEEADCPATRLRDLSGDASGALLRRWGGFGSNGSTEVALIPVDRRTTHRLSPGTLQRLLPGDPSDDNGHREPEGNGSNGSPTRIPAGGIALTTSSSTADDPRSHEIAMDADAAILVARRGTPAIRVRKAVRSLEEIGAQPRWALLLG